MMSRNPIVSYLLAGAMVVFAGSTGAFGEASRWSQEQALSSDTRIAPCPMMHSEVQSGAAQTERHSHADHQSEMNARGDKAMGFLQSKTTHHFRLLADGGAIEVEANDANDSASRDQIRQHLAHIAKTFANGDFGLPKDIHDQVPPGVPVMKQARE
ncbi:MAG TPA: hypothetical protein VFV34_13515, partial [Blastocatellia bacterium]|nr:hypothetical protein [Blastocatellia bacterium]